MSCHYCRWSLNKHDQACPVLESSDSKSELWNRGNSDGRAGRPFASEDQTYSLGYHNGVIAREEASNGFDPVHEGRQW